MGMNGDAFISRGSGLGINRTANSLNAGVGMGGGYAYGMGNGGVMGQERGVVGGPNGRERENGVGFEANRGESWRGI